ncbi:MAG: hypothetical protein ABSA80_16515 [Terriglobales bacterium]|jgi:hypothetical protein
MVTRPMIDGQAVRKIKVAFRVAANVAANMVQRSRTGRALLAGLRATANSFGRVLHQLWLEVTGFTFLALAGVGAMAGIREYGKYQSGHATGPGRLLLAVCFTVSFTWFGLSSFWRVKRRAKS